MSKQKYKEPLKARKKAFTLVELIVVITILAILGSIAFVSLQGYSADARDSKRISEVGNMRTALELYQVNSGKYPLPDNSAEVSYESNVLWTQGIFGETVTQKLSRNLTETPLDPRLETEYIYSVINTEKRYELLSLLEGESLVYNPLIPNTYASDISVTPKIDGNYEGIYVKTTTHIVPIPSIITSEDISGGLTLDGTNIQSQIISGGTNIPSIGQITSKTEDLDISLVTAAAITKDSTDEDKETAMKAIQDAYKDSSLATDTKYESLLEATTTEDLVALVDEVVLNETTTNNNGGESEVEPSPVNGICGADNGSNLSSTPTNLCTSGSASSVSGTGPWTWTCDGTGGGSDDSCNASLLDESDLYAWVEKVAPNGGNLNSERIKQSSHKWPGSRSNTPPGSGGSYNLTMLDCNASNVGKKYGVGAGSCSSFDGTNCWDDIFNLDTDNPVIKYNGTDLLSSGSKGVYYVYTCEYNGPQDGECGVDDGEGLSSTPTNLCKSGTASSVSGTGPWTWTCDGTGGSTVNDSCNASLVSLGKCLTGRYEYWGGMTTGGCNLTSDLLENESASCIISSGGSRSVTCIFSGGEYKVCRGGGSTETGCTSTTRVEAQPKVD